MGKYYSNNKKTNNNNTTTSDVTLLAHGVRTRARTLALRSFDSSFLQLRSRLLEKKIHTPVSKHAAKSQLQPKNHTQNHSRSTRESTPCNSITAADNISTPGSTSPTRNAQNGLRAREIEEFFSQEEHSQQQLFIQKYNFDVVHDKPLPGRYEWVKIVP